MAIEWTDVRNSDAYVKGGLVRRRVIRNAYFDDFIKTQPDFPQAQEAELKEQFTTENMEGEADLPKVKEKTREEYIKEFPQARTQAEKLGETELEHAFKTGAFGAAHTLASTIDVVTFGLSKHMGLSSKGVTDILKERGIEEPALRRSEAYGTLGGYGVMIPFLFNWGGGSALYKSLGLSQKIATGFGPKGLAKLVPTVFKTVPKMSQFAARTIAWGLTGFESGALREAVDVAFDKEDQSLKDSLLDIGIEGAKEAGMFMTMETLMHGAFIGGSKFMGTRPGKALLKSIEGLGPKFGRAFDKVTKLWEKHNTPAGKRIKAMAKAEGKTYEVKVQELKNALIDESNKLKTSVEIASGGREFEGNVEFPGYQATGKSAEILDAFGKPLAETIARETDPVLRTAEQKVALDYKRRQALGIIKPGEPVPRPDAKLEVPVTVGGKGRTVSSKIELTPKPKGTKALVEPLAITKVRTYNPDAWYDVEYYSKKGRTLKTMMSGDQLNNIENSLRLNVTVNDTHGIPIVRVTDVKSLSGTSGQVLNLMSFEDIFNNASGIVDKYRHETSKAAKKFGTPYFIADKYPAFKPIYWAIQDGIHYKNALYFSGNHILKPKQLLKLPKASKAKIAERIKLQQDPDIRRWFNEEELAKVYGFNPEEVQAYKQIQRMYEYSTNIEIKSRKLFHDYNGMSKDQQRIADEYIASQVKMLGGYVSQQRLRGEWTVFKPSGTAGAPSVAKLYDIPEAAHFSMHKDKASAIRTAKALGLDPKKAVRLRKTFDKDAYQHLSVLELESLVESADISTDSSTIESLMNVIRKRTFQSRWVRRRNVPGYSWDFDDIVRSADDYNVGAASKLSRLTGRRAAEKAFHNNLKDMSSELKSYARKHINLYYNQGSLGMDSVSKLMYTWRLAMKTGWLAQNITQPLATTYPMISQYAKGLQSEQIFGSSYKMAGRFWMHKIKGKPHGLSTELVGLMNKLQRQGVLGDQMTKFQLGSRSRYAEGMDWWLGIYGRLGEGINRSHAAISGYQIATAIKKFTNKADILQFMTDFVYKTQFAYGKQNLPQMITGAGNWRNLLKLMYTFRHFGVSYLQLFSSAMPWRGAKPSTSLRMLGALVGQAGVSGLPLYGLFSLAYKKMIGRTLEADIRIAARDKNIPKKFTEYLMTGMYNFVDVDASRLIGLGDIVPTYGSALTGLLGAPAGFVTQMIRSGQFAMRGDGQRALENFSPDAIKNLLKMKRYLQEGVRKASGELVFVPSMMDAALTGLGLMPASISAAWRLNEAKRVRRMHDARRISEYNQRIVKAIKAGDFKEVRRLRKEARSKKIKLTTQGRRQWMKRFKGRDVNVPRRLRRHFRELEKVF